VKEAAMQQMSLFEWIVTTAIVTISWQIYFALQPHAPENAGQAGVASAPARAEGADRTLAETLQAILRGYGQTDVEAFMAGARLAYEQVLAAYAAGDLGPVSNLLGPDIHKDFAEAIAARQGRGETMQTTFIGFVAAEPVDAGLTEAQAFIAVRFLAQMVSTGTDAQGRIVAGHPSHVAELSQTWTFSRDPRARHPGWLLVGVEDGA
jgi:predicted lipid-binding transport protein (Tim44 family)